MHRLGIGLALAMFGMLATNSSAAIMADTGGDTTFESVYNGYGGSSENLSKKLQEYVDPISGLAAPITRPNGQGLVVGDVDRGENPYASDQLQIQRFHVTEATASLQLTYLGVGQAGYKSIFGLYTYDAALNPATAPLTKTPLFIQNVDQAGITVNFSVPADHYFGFYLNANGHVDSQGLWYTENFRNTDNKPGVTTDHFLFFQTNRGLLMAIEDLPRKSNGLLGDQDYEDLLVGSLTYSNGTPIHPVPEPATLGLLMLGGLLVLPRRGHGRKRT